MTDPSGFSTRAGDITTIELTGELDLGGVPALLEELERVCRSGPAELVIDLGRLQFIDSAGLRLVLSGQELCRERGVRLRLLPGPPNVMRVFEISGLLEHLPFDPA